MAGDFGVHYTQALGYLALPNAWLTDDSNLISIIFVRLALQAGMPIIPCDGDTPPDLNDDIRRMA